MKFISFASVLALLTASVGAERNERKMAVEDDGIDMHLYAPFEGGFGEPPVPLAAALPFYSDANMTDPIGTLTLACLSLPDTKLGVDFPIFIYCHIAFGWHGVDEDLSNTDTILTTSGYMINGPLDGTMNGPFLQLFAITGGSGKYVGAKGTATIDPSLGLQDYQIRFAKDTNVVVQGASSPAGAVASASWLLVACLGIATFSLFV